MVDQFFELISQLLYSMVCSASQQYYRPTSLCDSWSPIIVTYTIINLTLVENTIDHTSHLSTSVDSKYLVVLSTKSYLWTWILGSVRTYCNIYVITNIRCIESASYEATFYFVHVHITFVFTSNGNIPLSRCLCTAVNRSQKCTV